MSTTSINSAIAAYNSAASSVSKASSSIASTGDDDSAKTEGVGDFASLLRDGAKAAVETGKKSEELQKAAVTGKADIRDVVAAVNNAELTLETVVAVRDKVITAYNDILHMAL